MPQDNNSPWTRRLRSKDFNETTEKHQRHFKEQQTQENAIELEQVLKTKSLPRGQAGLIIVYRDKSLVKSYISTLDKITHDILDENYWFVTLESDDRFDPSVVSTYVDHFCYENFTNLATYTLKQLKSDVYTALRLDKRDVTMEMKDAIDTRAMMWSVQHQWDNASQEERSCLPVVTTNLANYPYRACRQCIRKFTNAHSLTRWCSLKCASKRLEESKMRREEIKQRDEMIIAKYDKPPNPKASRLGACVQCNMWFMRRQYTSNDDPYTTHCSYCIQKNEYK